VDVYLLYSFFLFLALLVAVPVYFVRLKLLRRESLFLRERLGKRLPLRKTDNPFLWIHAVSVGEVLSLQNLAKEVRKKHPDWEIGFSTLTNTGQKMAREKLRGTDHIFFVPFDFPRKVRRAFQALRPRLLVLVESEFWPGLLREARRNSCHVLLVNGRISSRSFRRFKRFKRLANGVFKNISRFLVQTAGDKERLEKIGVPSSSIEISGNLKCEVDLPLLEEKDIVRMKSELGISIAKKIIVAGSIHRGEGGRLILAFGEARKTRDDLLLVLAPRHPEKFGEIEKIFGPCPFVVRRKTLLEPGQAWDILVLDTIGELARFYALSDAAFIGGSLVPWGGQNLLEPAFYGKPVFFGPHMENFAALAEEFVRAGAAKIVDRPEDLAEMFRLKDPKALAEMGQRAKKTLCSLQGATQKSLSAIEFFMGHAGK
jgi:3-deoxy-D-manno-octulosonic-acid transferase